MPERLLHHVKLGALLDHVGGESVPHRMDRGVGDLGLGHVLGKVFWMALGESPDPNLLVKSRTSSTRGRIAK